jgi:hypothetical protein
MGRLLLFYVKHPDLIHLIDSPLLKISTGIRPDLPYHDMYSFSVGITLSCLLLGALQLLRQFQRPVAEAQPAVAHGQLWQTRSSMIKQVSLEGDDNPDRWQKYQF